MSVPTPIILALTSASLCVLNMVVFPDIFRDTKLTTLFLSLTGILLVLRSIWGMIIYPTFFHPLRHIPTPKKGALPLLGHPRVSFRTPRAADAMLEMMTTTPNDGLIRFPGLFNETLILPTDPTTLADILVHKSYDFEKPKDIRRFLRIILGDGLILVEGDEHKFQRKHLAPAFSFRNIKELVPVFWAKAADLCARIEAEIDENPESGLGGKGGCREGIVEVNHWATKVTMDIIGLAGLGRDFNTLQNSDDELVSSYEEILEPTIQKALYFTANMIFTPRIVSMLPWKLNQRLNALMVVLRGACRSLIQERKEAKTLDQDGKDILSILMKSNNFADEMLVDQLLTFLAAGHETTSSSFTWATYLLATHPDIQTKLREEIRANIPSPTTTALQDPSFDLSTVLESLPLLHGICNETLRLYPPVPTTVRTAIRDTHIGPHPIPSGTKIFLSPWAINRSPLHWSDAAEFSPERWIDAATGKLNNHGGVTSNYASLTFLHGPRSCIGERFAREELKALVAGFVGRFEMRMGKEGEVPVPAGAITTKPRGGLRLRVRVVEGW